MKFNIHKIVFYIFVFLCLLFTLKGVGGNPEPKIIKDNLQKETMPFELSPERGRYALITSIVDYHSLYFPLEIAQYVIPDLGYTNGHFVSLFPAGVSYFAIPLYYLGKRINLGQLFAYSTISLFALFNVFLIVGIVQKITKNWYIGAVSGLTFLFATSAWPYAVTLYQHHVTSFFILATIYLLLKEKSIHEAWFVGGLYSLGFFVEYQNALFLAPLLLGYLIKYTNIEEFSNKLELKIDMRSVFIFFGIVIFLLPFISYNQIAYGKPFQLAGTVKNLRDLPNGETTIGDTSLPNDNKLSAVRNSKDTQSRNALGFFKLDNLPNSMSVLFTSKDRGILWFSPVILLSVIGVIPLFRKNRLLSYSILISALTVLFMYGMWGDPWGGWAFGPRYLIPFFAICSIFIGVAIERYSKNIIFSVLFFLSFMYSLFVSLTGSLTTLQIPPSVEIDAARFPSITYIHNFILISTGKSSSYVFNNYLKSILDLRVYFLYLFVMVTTVMIASYIYSMKKGES